MLRPFPLSLPQNWVKHFPTVLMYSIFLSLLFVLVYYSYGFDFFRFSFEHPSLFFTLYALFITGLLLEICLNTQGGFIPPKHDPVNFYFVFWVLSGLVLFAFLLPLSIYHTGECIAAALAFDEIIKHMVQAWGCTLSFTTLFLYTKHFTLDLNDIRRMHYEEQTVRTQSGKWEPVLFTQDDLQRLGSEIRNSYEIRKATRRKHQQDQSSFDHEFMKTPPSQSREARESVQSPAPVKEMPTQPPVENPLEKQILNQETSANTPLAYPHISSSDLPQAFTLEVDDMSDLHPEWLDPIHHGSQEVDPPLKFDDLPPPPYYVDSASTLAHHSSVVQSSPSSYCTEPPPLSFDVQEALGLSTSVSKNSTGSLISPQTQEHSRSQKSSDPHSKVELHQSFDTIGVACPLNEDLLQDEEPSTPAPSLEIDFPDWFDRK